jgi:hypothetical protein
MFLLGFGEDAAIVKGDAGIILPAWYKEKEMMGR